MICPFPDSTKRSLTSEPGSRTLRDEAGLATWRLLTLWAIIKKLFLPFRSRTKGNGYTAVVLDSICAVEIDTGLYPRLDRFHHRKSDQWREIERRTSRDYLVRKADCGGLLRQRSCRLPTFFEHVTAIALLAFREAGVQLAILETGLGGRLDATTAAGADTIAVTAIALDHQEYLGHTLAEIAAEKAAIIRSNVTAIIAPQLPEAMAVITARCNEVGVTPIMAACVAGEIARMKLAGFHR